MAFVKVLESNSYSVFFLLIWDILMKGGILGGN